MIAIIKTGGKQYKVSPGQKIKIEKLDIPEGKEIVFNEVLLVSDNGSTDSPQVKIGQPLVKDAKVKGVVVKQSKAKKVIVFKYKPKKRYKVKKGHRQPFSEVKITDIILPSLDQAESNAKD